MGLVLSRSMPLLARVTTSWMTSDEWDIAWSEARWGKDLLDSGHAVADRECDPVGAWRPPYEHRY